MRQATFFRTLAAALLFTIAAILEAQSGPAAAAPASPSLQEQLEAQYSLAKMTSQGGCTVTNPETGLVLQKPGIGALPQNSSSTTCAAHYRNGNITKTGFRCTYFLNMTKQNLVGLDKGDKVFPTKIEVVKDEVKVSFGYCSGNPGQAAVYTGQVIFEFPKDTLKNAAVTHVEDTIAEVFSMDASQQAQVQPPQPPENASAAPEQQASVEIGQSIDQVVSALGEPDTKAKGAGTKTIYIWKARKLKVTFVDGKVADVD